MLREDSDKGVRFYLGKISKIPLLTPEEECELALEIKKGSPTARSLMITANLRLVVKIAHDYTNLGVPLLDLISEGNIGLMKAIERFDPTKGTRLSHYAVWWIRHSIRRALANQGKTIRMPVHLADKVFKMHRVSLRLRDELGREPTDEEVAEELRISKRALSDMKTVSARPTSLDAPLTPDDPATFGEMISDDKTPSAFESLEAKNLRYKVHQLFDLLDERERKIIFQRFGFDGEEPKTLEEIAAGFLLTRERIRQIQNAALKKLRRAMKKRET